MGKKKRQGEPNTNTEDSSDTSDEFRNGIECSHITKSVDLSKLKKYILTTSFYEECQECKKNPNTDLNNEDSFMEFDSSLWMCLKCGNQACGRSKNQHALKHYKTPHSDSHSLCVNTSKWSVWCYDCDDEVNITSKGKLLECVEYLKKHSEPIKKPEFYVPTIDEKIIDVIEGSSPSILKPISNSLNLPKARGLCNLGNTCFFNSVMQCLGQTPHLLYLLEETSTPGQYFNLPGGKLALDEKGTSFTELDPLDGTLEEWKPLTKFLAETLKELQSGRQEVYNPRMLFSRLTQRMPQFGGGHQHDSHELLRHLLEAVREEDLRRYQAVILEKMGLSKKTDPSSVEGDKKKVIRFYGGQASELLLPTEQVFRGVLVSTLQCQDCGHMSHRDEYFLDLSLPISEKQTPPILRRKANEMEDNKPSKYQIKKEKRKIKKNNKNKHHITSNNVKIINSTGDIPMDEENSGNNSESESDADVEDNAEDVSNNIRTPEEGPTKGTESGYNSDKNGSPENISPVMCSDDSDSLHYQTGPVNQQILEAPSTDDDIHEEYLRPQSRLSFVDNKNNDIKEDLEKLTLKNGNKNNALDNRLEGACGGVDEDEDEKMDDDDDNDDEDLWSGTISPRYQIEDGECSVQSCLNQFTTSELMTANNKVGCELCTKRHGGPDKKTIYTNARKQLLIYNPPAVLILHLKRFQVHHFRAAKMSKFVKFPTVLDLAPFCSKRSKDLPTFEHGQQKVLYSLYGVVEHSGSMNGGHYVAYVRVRPKLSEDSHRWQFLPKNQRKDMKMNKPKLSEEELIPPGKWFYISDSYATEVTESKVLSAHAYLLFYERIL